MNLKVASTIGYEHAHQPLLRIAAVEEFVQAAIGSLGPQPPNFRAIVAINRGPLLREGADAHPLTPRQLELALDAGALVVDVRTELQFDEAHVPGAVCIPTRRAGFGSKLAWLAEPGQQIVFVGRDDHDAEQAAELAAAVGMREATGYLAGGMTSWREDGLPVARVLRMTLHEVHDHWERRDGLQVLDVRERSEWDEGHIPDSVHEPYHDLRGVPAGLDPQRPIAVVCSSGQRAAVGASLLKRHGAPAVIHVAEGGVPLWRREGWPIAV